MRKWTVATVVLLVTACGPRVPSAAEQKAIADSLTRQVKAAYDLSQPNVEQRLLSLYAPSGRIVSASGGQIIASRDTLTLGIRAFWENVGVNMRNPRWIWDQMLFDVPAPNVAVMTARYHVPHLQPDNRPHTIAGAWTAVFEKREGRWYIVQEHLSDLPEIAPDSATAHPMPMPPGHKMP